MSKKSWVQKRAECTPEGLFQRFYKMVRVNVQEMNNQSGSIRHHYTFSIEPGKELASDYFCVHRYKGKDQEEGDVKFRNDAKGRSIIIEPPLTNAFAFRHRWNPGRAKCDLTIDGEQVTLWQVCKRALEPLFFQEK